MINDKCDKSECCGCGACYVICPVKAISMVRDERGFEHPYINFEKCIHCNACEKVCVFVKKKNSN